MRQRHRRRYTVLHHILDELMRRYEKRARPRRRRLSRTRSTHQRLRESHSQRFDLQRLAEKEGGARKRSSGISIPGADQRAFASSLGVGLQRPKNSLRLCPRMLRVSAPYGVQDHPREASSLLIR